MAIHSSSLLKACYAGSSVSITQDEHKCLAGCFDGIACTAPVEMAAHGPSRCWWASLMESCLVPVLHASQFPPQGFPVCTEACNLEGLA